MQHLQWRLVRLEELGPWTSPQTYIIPGMPAVWIEYSIRMQLNSSPRSCRLAKMGGSYLEPHLDMDIRPSSAHDHRVTLVQARDFNLIVEQKQ